MMGLLYALLAAMCFGLWMNVTGGSGAESYNVADGGLSLSLALPNAASTTVRSAAFFDTGEATAMAVQPGNFEFLLTAPALTTTMLPDTKTMTYNIVQADDAAGATNLTVLVAGAIVQTGAGGVGSAAKTYRWRPPSVTQRYLGLQIVSGALTTDSSSTTATFAPLF